MTRQKDPIKTSIEENEEKQISFRINASEYARFQRAFEHFGIKITHHEIYFEGMKSLLKNKF